MNRAFIGLGSNLGKRQKYLRDAIKLLSINGCITVHKFSSIYETAPVGYLDQGAFLNMVIQLDTTLTSLELLQVCQDIEQTLGRRRTIKNGPRTVDLDILLFNNENRDLEKLIIPHPRMHLRAFVLIPLNEIAPDLMLPNAGGSVGDLLRGLPKEEIDSVVKWEG